jgi:hypothetical protein
VRTASLLSLSLVLIACPRVSSEVSLPGEPGKSDPPPQTAKPQPDLDFDVVRALDGVERILAIIDATASDPDAAASVPPDQAGTWLFDQGLRSLYWYGRSELSLHVLGDLFGTPVYASGPHGKDPEYAAAEFGHYDPGFVERVVVVAEALAADRPRVERTRPAFERRLRRQAVTYLLVYRTIHRDPSWFADFQRDYLASIGTPDSTFARFDSLEPMAQAFEDQGWSFHEPVTAAHFWVRREQDGTAKTWVRALEALLAAYEVEVPRDPPGLPAGVR